MSIWKKWKTCGQETGCPIKHFLETEVDLGLCAGCDKWYPSKYAIESGQIKENKDDRQFSTQG